MKEALESPKQQEIDRRTLLRKAVGITAGVLLLQHGVERGIKYNAAASPGYTPREIFIRYEGSEDSLSTHSSESTLTVEELGYIEHIEDTIVEPMDPDLSLRPISPIASIELNIDNKPDAQAKANLLSFNFSNLIYKNQDLFLQGLQESLVNGDVPEQDVSDEFIKELEENSDFRLNINALDESSGFMEIVPTSFDPKRGISIHPTNYEGIFRINKNFDGTQYYGFTPWVDGGKLHINLFVYDMEYRGTKPEIKDRKASTEYNYLLNNAMEFMVLTGGDQNLWDSYCLPLESKIVEERRERRGIMFDSISSLAMGTQADGLMDVKLFRS